ncbi:MAG: hypothetical protein KAT43_03685 [Nanoarchaeota archaeon]|nr:hypothetical protein [Nanoarchaeota archaeon]
MVKIKREHEMIFFTVVIIISIVFSLYYSGFSGDLPTGAAITFTAFEDIDSDGIPDRIETLCAAYGEYNPANDADGDLIVDACETNFVMNSASTDGDGDGVSDTMEFLAANGPALATDIGASPFSWLSSAAPVDLTINGQTARKYSFTFLAVDAAIGFAASAIGAISAYGGSVVDASVDDDTITFTILCSDTTSSDVEWELHTGENGALDSAGFPITMGDSIGSWDETLNGRLECPWGGGPGDSSNCVSKPVGTDIIRYVPGQPFEVMIEIKHPEVYRNKELGIDNAWARVPYPQHEGIKLLKTEVIGKVDFVEGISGITNQAALVKFTLVAYGYEGSLNIVSGFKKDHANSCFDGFRLIPVKEPIEEFPTVLCTPADIKANIEVDISDVALQDNLFTVNVGAELDVAQLPCDPSGFAGDVTVVSVEVHHPDAYLVGPDGKGTTTEGGSVSGGIGPGVGAGADGPGGKIDVPFIVTVLVNGYTYKIPTVVSFPIPIPDIPTIYIPDAGIITIMDPTDPWIPTISWPDGTIPPTADYPFPGPDPGPNPNPIPPGTIPDWFSGPRRIYGGDMKFSLDSDPERGFSTDEGRYFDHNMMLIENYATAEIFVTNKFGAPQKGAMVNVILLKDGKEIDAIRRTQPKTEGKAYDGFKIFTGALVAGEIDTDFPWQSDFRAKTSEEGTAYIQLDWNSLELGEYMLAASKGTDVEIFVFEKQGNVIKLKVPGMSHIRVFLELLERLPASIDGVTLFYDKAESRYETADGRATLTPTSASE